MDPSFPPFENFDAITGQPVGLDVIWRMPSRGRWGSGRRSSAWDSMNCSTQWQHTRWMRRSRPCRSNRSEPRKCASRTPTCRQASCWRWCGGTGATGSTDLGGRRVAVEWGSQGDAVARRLQDEAEIAFELLPRETVTAALDALAAGDADAAIVDAISLATYAGAAQLIAVGAPLMSDPYVVVTSADAPDLAESGQRRFACA